MLTVINKVYIIKKIMIKIPGSAFAKSVADLSVAISEMAKTCENKK